MMLNPHEELILLKGKMAALTIAYQQSLQSQKKAVPVFQLAAHKHYAL